MTPTFMAHAVLALALSMGTPSTTDDEDVLECRGPSPEICVARIRVAMREQLQAPSLASGPETAACRAEELVPCGRSSEGCASRPQRLVEALWRYHEVAAPARPEVLALYRRGGPGLKDVALQWLAEQKRPEALEPAVALLFRDESSCHYAAVDLIKRLGSPLPAPAAVRLGQLLAEGDWSWREYATPLLGSLGGPAAVAPLREAMQRAPLRIQSTAIAALGELGASAKSTLPELTALAASHWSAEIRHLAAEAATKVGGKPVKARSARCGMQFKEVESGWRAETKQGVITLAPVRAAKPALPASGPCTHIEASPHKKMTVISQEAGACLVGEDGGEWGGTLTVYEEGRKQVLRGSWDENNPWQLVRASGSLLVLAGTAHLGLDHGSITRVDRSPSGEWTATSIAQLPGLPFAHGLDAQQQLLVLVLTREAGADDEYPCTGGRYGKASNGYLLRVKSDGTLEPVL